MDEESLSLLEAIEIDLHQCVYENSELIPTLFDEQIFLEKLKKSYKKILISLEHSVERQFYNLYAGKIHNKHTLPEYFGHFVSGVSNFDHNGEIYPITEICLAIDDDCKDCFL